MGGSQEGLGGGERKVSPDQRKETHNVMRGFGGAGKVLGSGLKVGHLVLGFQTWGSWG